MQRDSVAGTLVVATVLCVVCSIVVSSAAVGLRGFQKANKAAFEKKNILIAAGLVGEKESLSAAEIEEKFAEIKTEIIDIDTGEPVEMSADEAENYDQRVAAKDKSLQRPAEGLTSIANREPYSRVFWLEDQGQVSKVILPVYGKGLWSTLYGFVAIERDNEGKLNQIAGITFYDHKETPGLGGEVENAVWKEKWKGKLVRDETGEIQIEVIKGVAPADSEHQVDGLSGATITSKGVTNTMQYWLSDEAFGKYLAKIE